MKYNRNIVTIIAIVISMVFSSASFAQGKIERPPLKEPQKSTVANTKTQKKKPAKSQKSNFQSKNISNETNNKSNSAAQDISKNKLEGEINGYKYVDLGLPSGTKWAVQNIGAQSSQEIGDLFAWGETHTKSSFDKNNSLTHRKNMASLHSEGIIDSDGFLMLEYDAAYANWGRSWRIPTKTEFEELKNICKWRHISYGGKDGFCIVGYEVIGPNGNSIFLPSLKYYYGESSQLQSGYYWSACPFEVDDNEYTYILGFSLNGCGIEWSDRYYGRLIRPVTN